MSEWKLFEGASPYFSEPGFFAAHPWVPPENQAGHAQRQVMVGEIVRDLVAERAIGTLTDLGCGDGTLLAALADLPVRAWGYDLGAGNLLRAAQLGVDARQGDLLTGSLEYGDLLIASEVIEHLADPETFLRGLPACTALVLSSPSAETAEWHYEHHAWAWDLDGYAALAQRSGWQILRQEECDGGVNWHGGVTRPQRFQALVADRAQ